MTALLSERNRLEALLREELSAQRAMLELLRRQEAAVIARTPEALVEVTAAIEAELSAGAARRGRREPVVVRIAELLRIAPSSVSLGGLVARLGDDGQRMATLRDELRDATARVVRQNRRVAALVGLHRRINQEVLELVLSDEHSNPMQRSGALVDAEV